MRSRALSSYGPAGPDFELTVRQDAIGSLKIQLPTGKMLTGRLISPNISTGKISGWHESAHPFGSQAGRQGHGCLIGQNEAISDSDATNSKNI